MRLSTPPKSGEATRTSGPGAVVITQSYPPAKPPEITQISRNNDHSEECPRSAHIERSKSLEIARLRRSIMPVLALSFRGSQRIGTVIMCGAHF